MGSSPGEITGLPSVGCGLMSSELIWDCIHQLPANQPTPPATIITTNTRRIFPNQPGEELEVELGDGVGRAVGGGGGTGGAT